jgi:flagellum-specific ATP synthase
MLARAQGFRTVVIALVGERGREVRDLIEAMPPEVSQKTIVVVSTGDESAMLRRLAPLTAMGLAEYFSDLGDDVLLIMDSVTRYAHACRDVAMAAGEPPVARGFPPGVFSDLPRLLERAGPGHNGVGSITGIFSVLVDGDDHNDPIADAIRGTLDGHIVLDRSIAEGGRYPAVDIPASLSRLADRAWTTDQRRMVGELRRMVSRYEDSRDLRSLGGYRAGADEELDRALVVVPRLYKLISQRLEESVPRDVYREAAECLRVERSAIAG